MYDAVVTWGDRIRAVFGMPPLTPVEPQTVHFGAGYSGFRVTDQLQLTRAMRNVVVDRAAALSVPAVQRGRNLICSISTLPLQLIDAENRVQDHPLFRQFDLNTPNVVMVAQTAEDLLFEAKAWWRVVARSADGYPSKVVRYDPNTVSLVPPADYEKGYLPSGLPTEGVVWMGGAPVYYADVIRFDSPNPAFLVAGERAIRRAIALDDAADLYATNRRMRGFFTPADPNVDPGDDDDIVTALDAFATARKERLDGYVPAALKYNAIQDPTPAEIQILSQQQRADLALANAMGIDPEDLGINTTSRTYQNATDRRRDRINDVLSPYMAAITDRLSMPDVTKRGQRARFWLDDYMRADPKTRSEVQQTYADMGVTDAAEIREAEGLPPRAIEAPPAVRPAVPATQISAIPAGAR